MKQGTAKLAEDYCFIQKALRPVAKARRQISAVPPSNSRPVYVHFKTMCSTVVYVGAFVFATLSSKLTLTAPPPVQSSSQNDLKVNKSVAKRHMRIQYSTALCKVCNIYIYVNYVEAVKHLPAAQKAHFETVKVPVQLLSQ